MSHTNGLWPHQAAEVEQHWADPARALLWQPRTGKTRTMVETIRRLVEEEHVTRILVVAPKLVCLTVWMQEEWPDAVCLVDLCTGSVARRADRLRVRRVGEEPTVAIINFDVLSPLLPELLRWKPQVIVADEMHKIKRAGSRRSRALHRLGSQARFRRGLTGTPDPQHLGDYYSQYKFLDSSILGTNLADFSEQYLVLHPLYRSKVIGYKHLSELRSKVFSIASRVTREKAFGVGIEPPPVLRDLPMTPAERSAYTELRTAPYANKLTKLLRLQQATARMKPPHVVAELDDIIEAGEKAVVWVRFIEELDMTVKAIEDEWPTLLLYDIQGDTSDTRRKDIVTQFRVVDGPAVVVCQIQTGALGIKLAAANYEIFSTLTWSAEEYVQAKDRIWEAPDKPKTSIHLFMDGTPDRLVWSALHKKIDVSERFLQEAGWTG